MSLCSIVPRELEENAQANGDQAVHVNLVDKRQEEYQAPPPPSYVAYSGEGKTAGYVTSKPPDVCFTGHVWSCVTSTHEGEPLSRGADTTPPFCCRGMQSQGGEQGRCGQGRQWGLGGEWRAYHVCC